MLLKGKTIAHAKMHQEVFVPNVAKFPPTLTDKLSINGKPLNMTLVGNTVYLQVGDITVAVPFSNFIHVLFAKEA